MEIDSQENEMPLPLAGERIGIAGKLASMSRADATKLCQRAGGVLVHPIDDTVTLVVRAEADGDPAESWDPDTTTAYTVIDETAWLSRVGLVDADHDVSRLYTPAMLAELLGVPPAAVRRWIRKQYLQPACEVRRLAYFDFPEVTIGRRLAELLHHGVSLAAIDTKLALLEVQMPDIPRPLAELAVVVEGRQIYLQQNGTRAEPSGQRLLEFDAAQHEAASVRDFEVVGFDEVDEAPLDADALRSMAHDLADGGNLERAIETYRGVHLTGEADAEDHFLLADLLYQAGQPLAARERYYMALEIDDDFIEARVNLGIVLGELNEPELGMAALRGAIDQHPAFADAHYQLAKLLSQSGDPTTAAEHWQQFLDLAPESPWAAEARAALEK